MKRAVTAATLSLLLCASSAWGQCVSNRVRFPRGRTTAVLKGRATAARAVCYELRARAGQRMTVHLTSAAKGAGFGVMPPGFDREPIVDDVRDWEAELEEDGDYVISVSVPRGAAAYTIEITIR